MSACRSKRIYAVLILVFIFAAALRFYYLELRPFHHDEGINALFTLKLINDGEYKYNPDNFHGPLLYYLTFIPLSLFGLESSVFQTNDPAFSDISFRFIPALLGSVIVLLILSLKKWLGRYGTAAAMILLAISPSCLYFSRYNIHEIYFITFTLLTFICGYHYAMSRKNIYIYLTMTNLAFLFTVKETAVVTCAVWAVALLITSAINTFSAGMQTVKSAVRNFGHKFARKIISPVTVFVIAWALLCIVIYSTIPYKTSWLDLNIILPFALLSGKFIQSLIESFKTVINRTVFAILSSFIIARTAYTAINISFINYDNDACKIVYVQTYRNAKELVKKTFELTKKYNGYSTKLNIITPDYWPLPWHFRNLTHAVWYGKMIESPDAPIIIADSKQEKHLESKLKRRYEKEHYCLRPGVTITIYYQIQEGKTFSDVYRFANPADLTTGKAELKPGLLANVYGTSTFHGNVIDKKVDTQIDFDYADDKQKPYPAPFSIIWTGYIFAPADGEYSLITESDDGSWIYINDKLVLDNGGEHAARRSQKSVYFKTGYHRITVKYFDQYLGAIMKLKWIPPHHAEEILPENNLFHIEQ